MRTVIPARKARDERGAYAVMFGLLVIVMFGTAALAVDLGNAFSRKSDVQGQADFAALAGGQELTTSHPTSIPAAVLTSIAESMNFNQPVNGTCDGCVKASQLVNGVMTDGEVQIVDEGLKVTAPASTVDFGFAGAIGQADQKDVQASAIVQIKTLGNGTMPMYAAAGCDYGSQTLADPASGQVTSTHDNLAFGADDNGAVIASITEPSPASIPLTPGVAGPALTVTGTAFVVPPKNKNEIGKHVSKIGFFRNDGATVISAVLDPLRLADQYWASIANIPAAVAGVEDVWWVRVLLVDDGPTPGPGTWSPEANAQPLRVGSAQLECDAGSSNGNFGTLRLPRDDVPTGSDLPMNIAVSLDEPLSLAIHEGADSSGVCADGINGAVESEHQLRAGTNCVKTDPGLAAQAAALGLVEGISGAGGAPGRLRTATVCGTDASIKLGHTTYTINGDTLECFLDDATSVAAITSPSYNGGTVLSEDIYRSPRFFWVPVLVSDANRGTKPWSIIDFRPAFLTDLHVQGNNIDQIKVVFFNWHALPSQGDGPVIDYLGTGPKVVRMVD